MYRGFLCRKAAVGVLVGLSLARVPLFAAGADPYAVVNRSWDRFGSVFARVMEDYYAAVPPDSIMLGAIEGMLGRLDAYSRYFDAAGLRQLREDTTGRYAGLGITVARMDGYPTVVVPMEGTPAARAGLVTGDQIVAIEGRSTRDMPLGDVVDVLRGDPDSEVEITVLHPGRPSHTRDVVIRRQLIEIPTVTLTTQIGAGVGYIGMRRTRFSESTAEEVSAALDELLHLDVQALVLDLRGNPGGLLTQAVQVADLFLPRGAPIVSIRERREGREDLRRSEQRPRARELPLAVLIDGGSASASEIVAGAIQDNDRGVIVGTTSFGKGSVQTIFDLHGADSSALKLTTARYYTPSGRCIHREVAGRAHPGELLITVGDQRIPLRTVLETVAGAQSSAEMRERLLTRFKVDEAAANHVVTSTLQDLLQTAVRAEAADDTSRGQSPAGVYRTRAGRRVFGGGGITPDVLVEPPDVASYVLKLRRLGVLFEFVVHAVAEDSARIAGLHGEELDQELIDAFTEYAMQREDLPRFDEMLRAEADAMRGTAETLGLMSPLGSVLDELDMQLDQVAADGFPPALQKQLLRRLKPQLALRLRGRKAQLRARLEGDVQLERAVDLLLNRGAYADTLSAGRSG